MKNRELHALPIECLWDGLVLSDDIYDYQGTTMLVPHGEKISADKIRRLYNFNRGDKNIMVYENTYYDMLANDNISDERRQKLTERIAGYHRLNERMGKFIHHPDAWLQNDELEIIAHDILEKLAEINPTMIFSCINFPRPMDEDLQRHSLNVAFVNGMMGRWLGLSEAEIGTLVVAGLLHDIGKTKIPEKILNAPRMLTDQEFKIVKMHPVYSEIMIGDKFGAVVRDVARHHHEKLNGGGYPDNLSGDKISKYTRITSLSDIYDAMIAKRSYKDGKTPLQVFAMLYENQFKGLDRELVMVFLKNIRRQYEMKKVVMSDGRTGYIRYIPMNDAEHPIVKQGDRIEQTNSEWFCREILAV